MILASSKCDQNPFPPLPHPSPDRGRGWVGCIYMPHAVRGDLQGGLRGGFSADLGSDSDGFVRNFGVDSGGFWHHCQVGSACILGSFWHLLVEIWTL